MMIDFAKMQSTGNDFILVECKQDHSIQLSEMHIKKMCDRRFGIGADGLIITAREDVDRISMNYFNSDGKPAAVCGNGLRAAALFAKVMGMIKASASFFITAGDGDHEALFEDNGDIRVQIFLKSEVVQINEKIFNLSIPVESAAFADTGVPHLVLNVKNDLESVNVNQVGKMLRFHSYFEPEGTNVNFVRVFSPQKLYVRTYERGIEDETYSCGTGVVASAFSYWKSISDTPDIDILVKGGRLKVFKKNEKTFLSGPSAIVFSGHYFYEQ
ncbi:MAG: diaminopimelate epimerase [Calditrichaceae bacterium]|nr:diaminopimelate epimerase [Calditrichaceae bacterium]MBN2709173.1 diaminopimelate epimerase [Calditrichaceae bacterium]RQV96129.1 MAG: diaminopimelate epimerase [Calditrichota bacterium]